MTHRLAMKGNDLEALSPRDANAQRLPKQDPKLKTAAQLRTMKEKDHPPPPPAEVKEPESSDRPDGAVYTVGKLLGKGGFAVCYSGVLQNAPHNRSRFALKIVKSQMPPKMEQKFQTELQIHSKMRQKNIVQFFRAFSFSSCTYLVLELCQNGSLMDMVKRRKGVTEAEVRFYSVQIAGAIKYMHAKGIIHRDLKMGNIFLDSNMNAKIGDFGLAALMVTGRDMQTMRRTTLCGTPNYIAPEILEKGKGGHDHMVDIWSLGIIMFAMLTSKPPFQSKTTDEIYRKARERDYEWPEPEGTGVGVSEAAKDLVATMLQEAEKRPDPDEIVQHPFFLAGYVPVQADMSPTLKEMQPDKEIFYTGRMTTQMRNLSEQNFFDLCRSCGVGPWDKTKKVHTQVWKEVAAEEKAGLTPAIPLAESLVYRPFDEWLREQKELQERFLQATLLPASSSSSSEDPLTAQRAPHGLLRQPPQSFAAQQRALSRPAAASASTKVKLPEISSIQTLVSRQKAREPAVGLLAQPATHESSGNARRKQAASDRPLVAKSVEKAQPLEKTKSSEQTLTLGKQREVAPAMMLSRKVSEQKMKLKDSAETKKQPPAEEVEVPSLFNPTETPKWLGDTQPEIVLGRLQRLETELERALNSRTMAFVSSRTVTPSHPHIVIKWVDYTNKYGLGYMLNNGSVGCIVRDLPLSESKSSSCPPSCVLVRGADSHFQRRKDPSYADRHQPTPMTENINFYEFQGESGLSTVTVSPKMFRISVSSDDTVGKMKPGKDIYEHRKRERVIVWKRFAHYMTAKGRDESMLVDDKVQCENENAELVIFYQGFGDVRCWVFGDGHLQFNFPDHTKIVLDPTGTWCHFWHLPKDAAERLAQTGTLGDAALDKRAALTYPLQTLLNFQTKPTTSRTARAPSSRRRPEIDPELQGIPAANDFRRKVEFIKNVVKEWVKNGGMGNSAMDRETRMRWTGCREATSASLPEKHVWVTLGARWGDKRLAAFVDPRKPGELGADIDETKKKTTES